MIRKIFSLFIVALLLPACEKDKPASEPIIDTETKISEVNKWVFDYMNEKYLWNDAIPKAAPDSAGYDEFLTSMLDDVSAQNNINKDDGVWENGKRKYYFSYITETPVKTKSGKESYTNNDFGILTGMLNVYNGNLIMHIMGVKPGSSADQNGITRSHVITKIDGKAYAEHEDNAFIDKVNSLISGENRSNMTIEWGNAIISNSNETSIVSIENLKSSVLSNKEYETTPIWGHKILTPEGNSTKVGYLNYNAFEYSYDNDLVKIFSDWKSQNIKEVVLDFRYNGGGHLISSVVISTALAGEAHKNSIFLKQTYNKTRTATGTMNTEYYFGNSNTPEGNYPPISSALNSALTDVTTVYVLCSNNTASASEAVINGLRGMDIEVRLIGERTTGKNVGMEPEIKEFDGNSYEFCPITFYSENAKGFKDFSGGFSVDINIDQTYYFPYNFGDPSDILLKTALEWIKTGIKPTVKSVTKSAQLNFVELAISKPTNAGLIKLNFNKKRITE